MNQGGGLKLQTAACLIIIFIIIIIIIKYLQGWSHKPWMKQELSAVCWIVCTVVHFMFSQTADFSTSSSLCEKRLYILFAVNH